MTNSTYAKKVRDMRVARAWSQDQLAEIAGVSTRTVQRIEAGDLATFDSLKAVASAFKIDVAELTAKPTGKPEQKPEGRVNFLVRVQKGSDLMGIVCGAGAYLFDQDDLAPEQVDLVADFLQELKDWGEVWSDVDVGERVRTVHGYTNKIAELEAAGLWVFAGTDERYFGKEKPTKLSVAVVYITKPENPTIVRVDHGGVLPTMMRS